MDNSHQHGSSPQLPDPSDLNDQYGPEFLSAEARAERPCEEQRVVQGHTRRALAALVRHELRLEPLVLRAPAVCERLLLRLRALLRVGLAPT